MEQQSVLASSTCEAEYVALYDTIRMTEAQGYLDFFLENKTLPLIFCDNKAALDLASTTVVSKRSKHINLRYHKVRDHVQDLCYCPTDNNKADPLTKPLGRSKCIGLFKCPEADETSKYDYVESYFVEI